MRRSALFSILALSLGGCSEYGYGSGAELWPDSQPPPLPVTHQTDVVIQTDRPEVDILWLVDNSCSMGNDQQELIAHLPIFMDFFLGSGLDYHVGVIPIWRGDGTLGELRQANGVRWVDPDTPNPIATFSQMADMGATAPIEHGIGSIHLALGEKRDVENAGFWRDGAALHTIVLSDQDDHTPRTMVTKEEFIPWYMGLKPELEERTFSSIVKFRPFEVGQTYLETTDAVGGVKWDLDEGDWVGALEAMGLLTSGYKREYFLSMLPVPDTIEVAVETEEGVVLAFIEGDWSYDVGRNSILFHEFIPPQLAEVTVSYDVLAATTE